MNEKYTLGYSDASVAFVERRRLQRDADYLLPFLKPGVSVLDCGCGPGTITCDIAAAVNPGEVVGLDAAESQIERARAGAQQRHLSNARFQAGDVYTLPFEANRFDCVFSHALLEHLRDPLAAMKEFHRVLKPGGVAAVRAPDWGAFLYAPESPQFLAAIKCFTDRQNANGGDVRCGHRLREYALGAGFREVKPHATFEVFEPVSEILDLLISLFRQHGEHQHIETLTQWAKLPSVMFAEAWVSCVGRK